MKIIVVLAAMLAFTVNAQAITAGVYRDSIPHGKHASNPAVLYASLRKAGFQVEYLTSEQMADPSLLNPSKIDLLVLPYGPSFPADAANNFRAYLRNGGRFLSIGGYPFDTIYKEEGGAWSVLNPMKPSPGQKDLVIDPHFHLVSPQPDAVWKCSDIKRCDVDEHPKSSDAPALRVRIPLSGETVGAGWIESLTSLKPGATYLLTAKIRADGVHSTIGGFAFIAEYQFEASGALGPWRDLIHVAGVTGWRTVRQVFMVASDSKRVELRFGIYNASGEAEMTDIHLYQTSAPIRLNTHFGQPGDGLDVSADQIGVCDPSFRFRRVAYLAPATGQPLFSGMKMKGDFKGWPATAMLGTDDATWEPFLNAYDRYGRLRGAAAAIIRNYDGYYKGSVWCVFGIDSTDLFTEGSPCLKELPALVRTIVDTPCLHDFQTNYTYYKPGESGTVSATISNFAPVLLKGTVRISLFSEDGKAVLQSYSSDLSLSPGESRRISRSFTVSGTWGDFVRTRVEFMVDGKRIQRLDSGFVIRDPQVVRRGYPVTWRDNYLRRGDIPQFLLGTDTYSNMFSSACETPLQWLRDTRTAKDDFITVFENLQGDYGAHGVPTERRWRDYEGLAQLIQKNGEIYFPCLLVGMNVAISDDELEKQEQFAKEYALRFRDYPGLIYYLDGDFQVRINPTDPAMKALFNRYLRAHYKSEAAFRDAWGSDAEDAKWGDIPIPSMTDKWDDVRNADYMRFETWLVRRWVDAIASAIRSVDDTHPITSEYYQAPYDGVDIVRGIGTLDCGDIGYFDRPGEDLAQFPQVFSSVDLRARGKGISVGEFGVLTHPAWSGSDFGYHTARTPRQARTLYMSLPFYTFALGGYKVQNWDWKDTADRIFPWGLYHSNALVPKTWLYTYRNDGILLGSFHPVYRPGAVWFVLANSNRIGGGWATVRQGELNGLHYLMEAHIPFNVINEDDLDRLPSTAKYLFWPIPFCTSDHVVEQVVDFVRNGGDLYLSGDVSFDPSRRMNRMDRLLTLAGVVVRGRRYPNIILPKITQAIVPVKGEAFPSYGGFPCLNLQVMHARVIETDRSGQPVAMIHRLGKGKVFFTDDPLELHVYPVKSLLGGRYYLEVARIFGIRTDRVAPNDERVLIFHTPCENGVKVTTVFNTTASPLPSSFDGMKTILNGDRPGLLAVDKNGEPIAFSGMGAVQFKGRVLSKSLQQISLLSRDGKSLWKSTDELLLPQGAGEVRLYWGSRPAPTVEVGEWREGKWTAYERWKANVRGGWISLNIDADRATCVVRIR